MVDLPALPVQAGKVSLFENLLNWRQIYIRCLPSYQICFTNSYQFCKALRLQFIEPRNMHLILSTLLHTLEDFIFHELTAKFWSNFSKMAACFSQISAFNDPRVQLRVVQNTLKLIFWSIAGQDHQAALSRA